MAGDIVENKELTLNVDITPSEQNPVISGTSLTLTAVTTGTVLQYTWTY